MIKPLTYHKPSGEWGIEGVDLSALPPPVYGALAKLMRLEHPLCGTRADMLRLASEEEMADMLARNCPVRKGCGDADTILDSLRSGVLVLPDWASYEVMGLPELGGVEVSQELAESETPAGAPGLIDMSLCTGTEHDEAEPPPVEIAAGRNKEEKLAILERLREYRRAHGLGCWNGVAQKAGGNITPELIRDMLLGKESPPIADWRRIDRAIQK